MFFELIHQNNYGITCEKGIIRVVFLEYQNYKMFVLRQGKLTVTAYFTQIERVVTRIEEIQTYY